MDPINVLVLINLLVSMSANWGGARKGFKTSITKVTERPQTYLQKVPLNVSAAVLVLIILAVFNLGVLSEDIKNSFPNVRLVGLSMFVIFSWIQVLSYRALGKSYAQDIVILKEHELQTNGPYRIIRHPQYLSQILSDLGAGLALFSYLVVPGVVIFEAPLLIMRAVLEDKMLSKHFKDEFKVYKSKSGFIFPFIG